MEHRIMLLEGNKWMLRRSRRSERGAYIFEMDQILKEIIVFFNGIQILKEYKKISGVIKDAENKKKTIPKFKDDTSSLIRQMLDKDKNLPGTNKSTVLYSTLDTWLIKKNEIKDFWDTYKKAEPVLKKVEQLREKYRTFWENLFWSSSPEDNNDNQEDNDDNLEDNDDNQEDNTLIQKTMSMI